MSLLRDIQGAALDSNVSISDLLRRCKVLAARLGHEELSQWVDRELNGYESRDELPPYRIVHAEARGDFVGSFGRALRNAPIPPLAVPKHLQHLATTVYLTEPISSLAHTAAAAEKHNPVVNWPPDVIAVYGRQIFEDFACLSARQVIPSGAIAGILDIVRSRILSFVLEIEAVAPDAGEARPGEPAIARDDATQIFQTAIYGDVGSLASGSRDFVQHSDLGVRKGDMESLRDYLGRSGIAPSDIGDLEAALGDDAEDDTSHGLGKRAAAWMANMIQKAASGVWETSLRVAPTLLTRALTQYLDLPH